MGALGNRRRNYECSLPLSEGVLELLLMSIGDGEGNGELGEYGSVYLEGLKLERGNEVWLKDEC